MTRLNLWQPKLNVNFIWNFSSYLTENTVCFHWGDKKSLNAVWGTKSLFVVTVILKTWTQHADTLQKFSIKRVDKCTKHRYTKRLTRWHFRKSRMHMRISSASSGFTPTLTNTAVKGRYFNRLKFGVCRPTKIFAIYIFLSFQSMKPNHPL
jgi:hypothetical protein